MVLDHTDLRWRNRFEELERWSDLLLQDVAPSIEIRRGKRKSTNIQTGLPPEIKRAAEVLFKLCIPELKNN